VIAFLAAASSFASTAGAAPLQDESLQRGSHELSGKMTKVLSLAYDDAAPASVDSDALNALRNWTVHLNEDATATYVNFERVDGKLAPEGVAINKSNGIFAMVAPHMRPSDVVIPAPDAKAIKQVYDAWTSGSIADTPPLRDIDMNRFHVVEFPDAAEHAARYVVDYVPARADLQTCAAVKNYAVDRTTFAVRTMGTNC
jgi:hypothetical protein